MLTRENGDPNSAPATDRGFHEGELLVQRRAGAVNEARRLAGMLSEPVLSAGMSRFIAERDLAFVTAEDPAGNLWTSPVFGPRGFCAGRDRTLTLASTVAQGDPLQDLRRGQRMGVLLIDFARRRRLRVNGVVDSVDATGLAILVEQAFGNCPRYIRPRDIGPHPERAIGGASRRGTELEPEQIAQIAAADTFILGTHHPGRGVDTSHRGGDPGFVHCLDGRLWWPDYRGNNLFNSLGNIVVSAAASLLFLDLDRGRLLQLSGRGAVQWGSAPQPDTDVETGRRVWFTPERIVDSTSTSHGLRGATTDARATAGAPPIPARSQF